MQLQVFDTLSRQLEEFIPLNKDQVTFYHCGPTVYWTQHIGNLRGMTMADLVRRTLLYKGYEVKFVRNYTDVGHLTGDNLGDADSGEDRMEKGAKREGLTPQEIADKYIKIFEEDTKALNIIEPNVKPRATEYIAELIKITQGLLNKGFAYSTPKAIYFDVSKFPDYNKLNKQKVEMNLKGAGTGTVEDVDKKNSQDFALWFFKTETHKNALQYWESPFESSEVEKGYGFPGWHIECSAMAIKLLGETIDIHMGGIEHISVHHTNEIAQSECYTGKQFVRYWLHNEHLLVDGKKMSKSEGTSYNLKDIQEKGFSPLDLRYFFLQSHYRSKQNFTWEALEASKTARAKLVNQLAQFAKAAGRKSSFDTRQIDIYKTKFIKAINDDFNLPAALAVVWETLRTKDLYTAEIYNLIIEFDKVLGLEIEISIKHVLESNMEITDEAAELIKQREQARVSKNWTESDRLRDLLKTRYKILVEDTKEGQKTEIIS